MDDKQEQKILKHLKQIRQNITDITPHVDYIDGAESWMRTAGWNILTVESMLKKSNQKEDDGREEKKEESKEETIQHKDEGQEI